VWMRTAALSNFRKLWGRIDQFAKRHCSDCCYHEPLQHIQVQRQEESCSQHDFVAWGQEQFSWDSLYSSGWGQLLVWVCVLRSAVAVSTATWGRVVLVMECTCGNQHRFALRMCNPCCCDASLPRQPARCSSLTACCLTIALLVSRPTYAVGVHASACIFMSILHRSSSISDNNVTVTLEIYFEQAVLCWEVQHADWA